MTEKKKVYHVHEGTFTHDTVEKALGVLGLLYQIAEKQAVAADIPRMLDEAYEMYEAGATEHSQNLVGEVILMGVIFPERRDEIASAMTGAGAQAIEGDTIDFDRMKFVIHSTLLMHRILEGHRGLREIVDHLHEGMTNPNRGVTTVPPDISNNVN